MAGEAKSNAFMLASATVMIGTQAQLYSLNPATHSIGLVKNFAISAAPAFTDLTQGVKNEMVYSMMTGNPVQATMEAYEFTSKNLAYGLGLDGSSIVSNAAGDTVKTQVVGDGSTTNSLVLSVASDTHLNYVVGNWIYVQGAAATDAVHLAKVTSSTYAAGPPKTVTVGFDKPIPTGMTVDVGALVAGVNRIDVGSTASQPFFSAKVVGVLPENNEPITLLMPKVRIVKGFTLAFQSGQFGNLPFEFKPLDLVPTDTFYADFAGRGPVAMFARQ